MPAQPLIISEQTTEEHKKCFINLKKSILAPSPLSFIQQANCGPGLYTERLAKTNAAITGIDFSRNSIEYARSRARDERLNINYINQNYLEFNADSKYDLILMIFCDFCALSPAKENITGKIQVLTQA